YRPAASSPLLSGADFDGLVGIQEFSAIAGVSIYPNPTNGDATLFVDVAQQNELEVFVMNSNGQVLQRISNQYTGIGTHQFIIQSSEFAAGLYYAVIRIGNDVKTMKLSIVK